jgi:hypothetical protein
LRAATDPVSVAAEARCALLIVRCLRPDRLLQSTALFDIVYSARSSSVAMGSREVHIGGHQKTRKCRPGKHLLGCPYQLKTLHDAVQGPSTMYLRTPSAERQASIGAHFCALRC